MADRTKTWWGEIFLEALSAVMDTGRLERGRSYSGDSRVVEFGMNLNKVTARMRGNINPYFGVYKTPYYNVQIQFTRIEKAKWTNILEKLGSNADWVTHLILGEVPPTIEEAFQDTKVGLLPKNPKEIKSNCSCPDWANPCKHVAGAYYRVAALLDRDPLVLFELRGMKRKTLLQALQQSPFGAALQEAVSEQEPDLAISAEQPCYPKVETCAPAQSASDLRAFWHGKSLPATSASELQPLPLSALLLRREGDYPEFWNRHHSFLETMSEVYERIAKSLPEPPEQEY